MGLLLLAWVLGGVLGGCTERHHRNPLDPLSRNPERGLEPLAAIAGNGVVGLRWNFTHFDDIHGYQLYRRSGTDTFKLISPLAPGTSEFVDTDVQTGTSYDYKLDDVLPYINEAEGDHYEETNSVGRDAVPLIEEMVTDLLEWTE